MWTLSLFVTLIVWFSFMSTIGVYFYMGINAANLETSETSKLVPQEQLKITDQIKKINHISQKVVNIMSASHSPEKVLNSVIAAKPEGIELTNYFVDFESGTIRLKGISQTRVNLIDFKYKLEENNDFSLVSVPISSFEGDKDFSFEMNFSYLPIKSVKAPVKK